MAGRIPEDRPACLAFWKNWATVMLSLTGIFTTAAMQSTLFSEAHSPMLSSK